MELYAFEITNQLSHLAVSFNLKDTINTHNL